LTTEGGLDVVAQKSRIAEAVARLQQSGIQVSLFIDPDAAQMESAREVGAHGVEIHTGAYCNASGAAQEQELAAVAAAAQMAHSFGLEVHGGHGLNLDNVSPIARIAEIVELNIGHSIIARALMVGIGEAVREMKAIVDRARDS
jgi:pyridoxine 5-phosphate synthase